MAGMLDSISQDFLGGCRAIQPTCLNSRAEQAHIINLATKGFTANTTNIEYSLIGFILTHGKACMKRFKFFPRARFLAENHESGVCGPGSLWS